MTALAARTDRAASPPAARAEGRSFRPDIEVLRAFAVLSVLVYHLGPRWLPGGFPGVDVFFVISGFLITSLLAGERAGPHLAGRVLGPPGPPAAARLDPRARGHGGRAPCCCRRLRLAPVRRGHRLRRQLQR